MTSRQNASPPYRVLLAAALILGPARAGAETTARKLPVGSHVLIRTTSGEFIDAKLGAARPDSILLQKGKRTVALPVTEVQDVWRWRRDPIRSAAVNASFGAVLGAIEGWAVPGDCVACDDDRGSTGIVLRRMLTSAGWFGLSGLVSGVLDGAWEVHPGIAGSRTTATGPPIPPWALSATAGRLRTLESGESFTTMALAGYRNSSPTSSVGFEFGVLEFPRRRDARYIFAYARGDSSSPPTSSYTIMSTSEASWTYGTLFFARARQSRGNLRAQFLFGPALYARRVAYRQELLDSTGVVTRTDLGNNTQTKLGVMTGVGATIGSGTIRPTLRARGHWVFRDDETFAITLEAGVDWH